MSKRKLSSRSTVYLVAFMVISLVLSVFAVFSFKPTVAQAAESWPQWRYDPAHTGYVLNAQIPKKGELIWKTYLSGMVTSSPAVVGGKVYIGNNNDEAHKEYVFVWCLDAATGDVVWKYKLPSTGPGGEATHFGVGWSSPAVVDGKVYIGAEDHYVYCLDAAAGTLVWKYLTDGRVYSSPCVTGGKVYISSDDRNVYCLDAAAGTLVWNKTLGDRIYSSPAVAGGSLYIGGGQTDTNLYCLNVADGTLEWSCPALTNIACSPCVGQGMVYFMANKDMKIYAVDAAAGSITWTYSIADRTQSSLSYGDNRLYGGSSGGGAGDYTYCLTADTGKKIWGYRHYWAPGSSSTAVVGGINGAVVMGSQDGYIKCLNASTGTLMWEYPEEDRAAWWVGSPAVVNAKVYIGCLDGYLYCLGDAAGAAPRMVAANDCLPPPPALVFNASLVAMVAIAAIAASLSMTKRFGRRLS